MLKEGHANIIDLDLHVDNTTVGIQTIFEPAVIHAVLEHLYGRLYGIPEDEPHAVFHAKVYSAGDYFQLTTLKKEAQYNLKKLATMGADVNLGSQWRRRGAPKHLLSAAGAVYNLAQWTDKGIKNILFPYIRSHLRELINGSQKQERIIKEVPGLAYDLLHARIFPSANTALNEHDLPTEDLKQAIEEHQRFIKMNYELDDDYLSSDIQSVHLDYLIVDADEREAKKRKRGK